ncbi:hypothetical protein [Paenibacillus glucanolyticus]|uniref:hypothetical protein n=1 Tax=Paenibacillus glucanolyticus TaxID=59843 RepID=UPI000AC9A70B|nr:hypothetical protein [Paenibacillus glucanolyticus]
MSEKKKMFSDSRWNDTSKPKIIGYRDITEEEEEKYSKMAQEFLRKKGVIKKDK